MNEITKADLGIAFGFARNCLDQCDGIFRKANLQPDSNAGDYCCVSGEVVNLELPLQIKKFCDFLDSSRATGVNKIPKINRHLIRTRFDSEPISHGSLVETTAHSLIWKFTHNLWATIHSVVYADSVVNKGKEPEADGLFQLDPQSINENLKEIRERILGIEPIDTRRFRRIIEIECEKAVHALAIIEPEQEKKTLPVLTEIPVEYLSNVGTGSKVRPLFEYLWKNDSATFDMLRKTVWSGDFPEDGTIMKAIERLDEKLIPHSELKVTRTGKKVFLTKKL